MGERRQWREQRRTDESLHLCIDASNGGHRPRHVPEPVPDLNPPSRLDRELEGLGGLEHEHDRVPETFGVRPWRGRTAVDADA